MKKNMIMIFMLLFLVSCDTGNSGGGSAGAPANSSLVGVSLDSQVVTGKLFDAFEKVKACSGFEMGEFVDLSVLFIERSVIDCDRSGCKGAFISPNIVHLSALEPEVWRHEFMHYLLLVNTGNAFNKHQHALFRGECPGSGGGASAGAAVGAEFAGVFLDPEVSFKLFEAFEEAKVCSGFKDGDFLKLSILFRERSDIACDSPGCTGAFLENPGNLVYLSALEPIAWRHEFIHYLLFVNTGDAHLDHQHKLFQDQNCIKI